MHDTESKTLDNFVQCQMSDLGERTIEMPQISEMSAPVSDYKGKMKSASGAPA